MPVWDSPATTKPIVPATAIGNPSAADVATQFRILTLHAVMNGTDRKAPPAPTMLEISPMPPPTAKSPPLPGQLARRLRLPVEQDVGCRHRDECAEERRQQRRRHPADDLRTEERADDDPRGQSGDDRPQDRAVPVMLAHRRHRREQNRRRRRRDGHVHDVLRRESLPREHQGEQRHHGHPAAQPEQPGKKADDCAQDEKRDDQRRIHHLSARPAARRALSAPSGGSERSERGGRSSPRPAARRALCAASVMSCLTHCDVESAATRARRRALRALASPCSRGRPSGAANVVSVEAAHLRNDVSPA